MKKIILLFSHSLTSEQKVDLKEQWGIESYLSLPQELQNVWSNFNPQSETIIQELGAIKEFLKQNANKEDVVLVQGDFGATYNLVNFCKEQKLRALYATTQREVIEYTNEKGEQMKKSKFEHVRFREYGK